MTIFLICILSTQAASARSLTPPAEPKDDSFYICYEKRFLNAVTVQARSKTLSHGLFPSYSTVKYIGCIISRLPCQFYIDDKFHANPVPLKQFQWMDTYPKALNSFYRCAYS